MNIGFDFDKIFINTPPFIPDALIDKLYKKKDNGILLYRIPSYPDQLLRRLTHLPWFRPPIAENISFITSLPKGKNKLYIISSRYRFLEGETNRLIKNYHFDKIFDGIYFNFANEQPHEFKDKMIKKLSIDKYIDDDLSLLKYVAAKNPKTHFFWLNDRNQEQSVTKNIMEIKTLKEVFSK